MTRPLPADLVALVRAGRLEEAEPGLFRRPRLPSREELHGNGHRPADNRPPPQPHGRTTRFRDSDPPPLICESCGQNMRDWDLLTTCIQKQVQGLPGRPYLWPDDDQLPPNHRCHDCWVPLGAFHHWECCVEECPCCGGQLLTCGCFA